MSVTKDNFKKAMGAFPSGVTVITTRLSDGTDVGMTASAFSSLSMDPPLGLVCIQNRLDMCGFIKEAGGFAVNILSAEQQELSNRFAGGYVDESGQWQNWPEDKDKFADLTIERGAFSGSALIRGARARIDCRLHAVHPGGDHGIFVGHFEQILLADAQETESLLSAGGRYRRFAE